MYCIDTLLQYISVCHELGLKTGVLLTFIRVYSYSNSNPPARYLLVCTWAQDERPADLPMAQPNVPVSKTGRIPPAKLVVRHVCVWQDCGEMICEP
jgi:hypothetical protein